MIWVTWRQHRVQALTMIGVFALIAIYALALGLGMRSSFSADGLGACLTHSGGADCGGTIRSFFLNNSKGATLALGWLILPIPGLLGAAVGAPILGSELARGTWQLAWTQTVPRRRWLAAKLGLIAAGLVLFSGLVTVIMTWAWGPLDQAGSRLAVTPFLFEGIALPCALLCSSAIALLAGLLLRNTIGGMYVGYLTSGVTLFAAAALLQWVHLFAATMTVPCAGAACAAASASSAPPVTGHLGDLVINVTHAGNQLVVSYVPASAFWPLQLIIGGFFLAVAAAAAGTAFRLLNRRTT
jgi:hypothetical protein